MGKKPKDQIRGERTEDGGNRTIARRYNEAQPEFVRSGKVDKNARTAEKALNNGELDAIKRAPLVGNRH